MDQGFIIHVACTRSEVQVEFLGLDLCDVLGSEFFCSFLAIGHWLVFEGPLTPTGVLDFGDSTASLQERVQLITAGRCGFSLFQKVLLKTEERKLLVLHRLKFSGDREAKLWTEALGLHLKPLHMRYIKSTVCFSLFVSLFYGL